MSKTLTVEGDIASVDTRTNLTTQGSVTAPSTIVPSGATKITKIIAAASSEGLADGGCVWVLRLGGGAIKRGEQTFLISASGRIAVQAGSDAAPQVCFPITLENVDLEVSPSDSITIAGEMCGVDTGTGHMVVTLVFE